MDNQPVIPIILKALALAMGAAVVVLGILGSGSVQTNRILLGLGLFSLALGRCRSPNAPAPTLRAAQASPKRRN